MGLSKSSDSLSHGLCDIIPQSVRQSALRYHLRADCLWLGPAPAAYAQPTSMGHCFILPQDSVSKQ